MARGVNKVILVGNLGNDPDVKYTQAGMAITTLSVATTSVRKDRDGNQVEKNTGPTRRTASSTTPPTSSPTKCRCWVVVTVSVVVAVVG